MTSRLTSDARIPSCPMLIPSLTVMVPNSIANPPASRMPVLGVLGQLAQRHVARRHVIPRGSDGDLWLHPIVVGHAHGAQHGASRRLGHSVGDVAASRLDVDLGAWFVRGHGAKLPDPDLPDLIRYGGLRSRPHAGCSTIARVHGACIPSRRNARSLWSTNGTCSRLPSRPTTAGTITVDWGGGHVGVFPAAMLTARTELAVTLADLAPLQRISHIEVDTDEGMEEWLGTLLSKGAIIVEDTPNVTGEVIRLAERIGYARPTNFGTIFDVESRPDPNNSAYTAAGLDLHTDLPNWAYPPDFQFLHVLANEATGGDSVLADGVAVAKHLRSSRCEGVRDPQHHTRAVPLPRRCRRHPVHGADHRDRPRRRTGDDSIQQLDPRCRSVRRRALLRCVPVAVATAARSRKRW